MNHLILIVSMFFATSYSQNYNVAAPTCQTLANQTVFNGCITAVLKVKGTSGAQQAKDQVGACYTQMNNGTAYAQCLCAKTSAILNCYDMWCQGDAGQSMEESYQLLFCKAFHAGASPTAPPVIQGIPPAPTGSTLDGLGSNGPVVQYNYGTDKSDGLRTDLVSALKTVFGIVSLIFGMI